MDTDVNLLIAAAIAAAGFITIGLIIGLLRGYFVNDRLRVEVREELGAAYSPGSGVQQSMVYQGVGMLLVQAMADPDKVDTLLEACLVVGDALAADGVTAEELAAWGAREAAATLIGPDEELPAVSDPQ